MGKLDKDCQWWYKGKQIEVVNNYKYLGIDFNFAWNLHFKGGKVYIN